jgi:cytochrome c5
MDVRRSQHVKAHQPEKAKTLMRHVVAKPKFEKKTPIKTAVPSELMAKPASELAKPLEKKVSVTQVNPIRLARSRQVARSQHIQRYSQGKPQNRALPAANVVARQLPAQHASAVAAPKTSQSQAMQQAVQTQSNRQKAADIFEAALAHANAHQEPLQPKQGRRAANRRRWASIGAGLGAFLVIGGFLAYLNMPKIELQVASVHAGFHAAMPSYKPNGYALDGGVKSTEGRVEMTFRSGASAYRVTQEVSDWNSATLLDQNTEQRGAPEQTIQSKGRIIYIYDDSTATWVDSGVRYEINGNAGLSQDELVSLATSM